MQDLFFCINSHLKGKEKQSSMVEATEISSSIGIFGAFVPLCGPTYLIVEPLNLPEEK